MNILTVVKGIKGKIRERKIGCSQADPLTIRRLDYGETRFSELMGKAVLRGCGERDVTESY